MTETVHLWSQDYEGVLYTTTSLEMAKQFFIESGQEWMPIVIDYGTNWKQRWSGRIELENDQAVIRRNSEYLKYITQWPTIEDQ